MERIKQALERARQDRAEAAASLANVEGIIERPAKGRGADSAADTQNIVYTQSRTIELSPHYLKQNRVIYGPEDPHAETYKVLRTHVSQRMRQNQWRTLAVTSPTEGCGKTLTTINLAVSLAREVNHTVLLVDLDLRRPTLRKYLTEEELPGMSNYLIDEQPLEELLFNPGIERLVVLPGNEPISHSSEMLSTPKMVALVEEIKERYPSRLILFDMPPVLACDDVIAFTPFFDAAMIVVEDGMTIRHELQRALELLEHKELMGLVLNKASAQTSGYGYGYSYGYGYEYGTESKGAK